MLRKNSIVKFVLLFIVAIIGVLLCVCPFSIPNSTNKINGFVGAINKGVDLNGGVSAVYDCTLKNGSPQDLDEAVEESLQKINDMMAIEGFSELYVTKQGSKIAITTTNVAPTNAVFGYFENGKELSFTVAENSDSHFTSADIEKVVPEYNGEESAYGVRLHFNQSAKEKLDEVKTLAQETSGNIYVYLGEKTSDNLIATLTADSLAENIFLASSNGYFTINSVSTTYIETSYTIFAGTLDFNMDLLEVGYVSPILGQNTQLYIGIGLIILMFLSFVFMYVRYGQLGLLGCLSLIFYSILLTFFMLAIPFITLNIAGVFGIILSYILVVFVNAYIFEKVKEEYSVGKKIHVSFKSALKRVLWPIIDLHVVLLIASIFMWIFLPASLKCFAVVVFVGLFLSVFSSLVMTRYFMKIYLPINSTRPKKLRLYRDKGVVEMKDEEVEIIPEDQVGAALEEESNE